MLIEQKVRGVLITPADDRPGHLDGLRDRNIAVALLDRETKNPNQCSVSVDDVPGGEIGIQHLISLGHTRIQQELIRLVAAKNQVFSPDPSRAKIGEARSEIQYF